MGVSCSSVLPQPVQAALQLPPRGRVTSNPGGRLQNPFTRTNSFDGGTNSTTITTGNSGGTSGNAFSTVTIGTGATDIFDSTLAAHGSLSCQVATTGTSATVFNQWNVPVATQVWFRQYLYFTANPAAQIRVLSAVTPAATAGSIVVLATGQLRWLNGASAAIFTTTATIPLNQWFRIEGFITGDPLTGQVSLSLYYPLDAQAPVETRTSAATQNTIGPMTGVRFGISTALANGAPYWMDDIGASSIGPLGPVSFPGPASLGKPVRASIGSVGLPPRGRVASNPGTLAPLLLLNSFAGGSDTTTITTGNSGGTSGNAFGQVVIGTTGAITFSATTYTSDSLSAQVTQGITSSNSTLRWNAAVVGVQPVVWVRGCCFFTGAPGASVQVMRLQAGSNLCSAIQINSSGQIVVINSANSTAATSTFSIPFNSWFRLEVKNVAGSNGQVSVSLFATPVAQTPVSTLTVTTSTLGPVNQAFFGIANNVANVTYWLDSIGVSNTGPLGPVSFPGPASLGYPVRTRVPQIAPRGRVTSNPGAGVRNPTPGPVFRQAIQPVRARIPQRPRAGGLVAANQHTPPYVPPDPPPPPAPAAPALDASPLPSLITTFPGTT